MQITEAWQAHNLQGRLAGSNKAGGLLIQVQRQSAGRILSCLGRRVIFY